MEEGFLIILHDHFVQNFLQDILEPTVPLTVIRLSLPQYSTNDSIDGQRIMKLLTRESIIENGKYIKIIGLMPKSWYQVCIEFENLNRHTGVSCKMCRTLDKYGKMAENLVSDVFIQSIDPDRVSFLITANLDFPAKLTIFLNVGLPSEAKSFLLNNSMQPLTAIFQILQPATDYGSLCIVQEPSPIRASYTAMGRLIQTRLQRCFFENLRTKPENILAPKNLEPKETLQRDHVIHKSCCYSGNHWCK